MAEFVRTFGELLDLHDRSHVRGALRDSLGDGYVVQRNPVVRNVRQRVRALGFTFSPTALSEVHGWPLMGLRRILESKTIPYRDTVSLIRDFERRNPKTFTTRDLIRFSRPNMSPVLHESMHGVADAFLTQHRARARLPLITKSPARERHFSGLLGESIVNATEAFAMLFGTTEPAHDFFLRYFHSQVTLKGKAVVPALWRLIDRVGVKAAYELMVVAYLHFNALFKEVDTEELSRSFEVLGVEGRFGRALERDLQIVFTYALGMNRTAAVYTTFFYQYFMRFSSSRTPLHYMRSLNFDILEPLSRPHYRDVLAESASVVTAGW